MSDYYVGPNAQIGHNNKFGTGVIIKDGASLGDDNYIGDYVVIEGDVNIGSSNYIYNFVSIGGYPQHSRTKYEIRDSEKQKLHGCIQIGNENIIREFTTIHLPTLAATTISNNCYIMAHSHIAHDVFLEDDVIMSNSCDTGGHARLLQGANLGKAVQVHPRTIIGQFCMIGMGTIVVKNILPGITVVGNPAQYLHINKVGLERHSFSESHIKEFEAISNSNNLPTFNWSTVSLDVLSVYKHFFENMAFARKSETVPIIAFPF